MLVLDVLFFLVRDVTSVPKIMGIPALSHVQTVFHSKSDRMFNHVFTGYMSSQELCTDVHRLWWENWLESRSVAPKVKPRNPARAELIMNFLILVGAPETYNLDEEPRGSAYIGPTQSIQAEYGHNQVPRLGSRVHNDRECNTRCEDRRPPIEIWIQASKIYNEWGSIQVRDKGPLNMLCPEGHTASILEVEDRRSVPIDEDEDYGLPVLMKFMQVLDKDNKGEASFPNTKPRVVGDPVEQCFCVPDPEPEEPVTQWVTCSDFDSERALENIRESKKMKTIDPLPDIDVNVLDDLSTWIEELSGSAKLFLTMTVIAALSGDLSKSKSSWHPPRLIMPYA